MSKNSKNIEIKKKKLTVIIILLKTSRSAPVDKIRHVFMQEGFHKGAKEESRFPLFEYREMICKAAAKV